MKPYRQKALCLGAHFSIAKGLHRAITEAAAYQCNTLQIFTKNASTWKEKTLTENQIQRFLKTRDQTGITEIISHASYLINLASPEVSKTEMSREAIKQEIIRCGQLEIPYLVLHPGSHMGDGEAMGIRRISKNINQIFDGTAGIPGRLLLETTAGQGSSIGHRFEHLAAIIENVHDPSRIGVCLDTCHIFAAGYDISTKKGYETTLKAFNAVIGLKNLFVLHLNDAKKECGAHVDRHTHIGDGFIGTDAFERLINDPRLTHIPKIIETPKRKNGQDADTINLKLLRNLLYP